MARNAFRRTSSPSPPPCRNNAVPAISDSFGFSLRMYIAQPRRDSADVDALMGCKSIVVAGSDWSLPR
jgi:hypothetical protein